MAEEFFRSNTNLKPSEIKAAFERSRNIDAQLDKERENKEKEIQLLTLGMYAVFFFFCLVQNTTVDKCTILSQIL